MAKYLIRHWVNVDVIAEKIVDESIYEKKEGLLIRKESRMRLDQ